LPKALPLGELARKRLRGLLLIPDGHTLGVGMQALALGKIRNAGGHCAQRFAGVVEKAGLLYKYYEFTILSGMSNPDHDKIVELLKNLPNTTVQRHCSDMPDLFSKIDYAIGAAGGMNTERNVAGIPSIVVEIADNQKGVCDLIRKYNLGECLKVSELKDPTLVNATLQKLSANRSIYTHNCQKLYSKNGILNVVKRIKELLTID